MDYRAVLPDPVLQEADRACMRVLRAEMDRPGRGLHAAIPDEVSRASRDAMRDVLVAALEAARPSLTPKERIDFAYWSHALSLVADEIGRLKPDELPERREKLMGPLRFVAACLIGEEAARPASEPGQTCATCLSAEPARNNAAAAAECLWCGRHSGHWKRTEFCSRYAPKPISEAGAPARTPEGE